MPPKKIRKIKVAVPAEISPTLQELYQGLVKKQEEMALMLSIGMSMITSAVVIDFIFRWGAPEIYHRARSTLSAEELLLLSPGAKLIWETTNFLKDLAQRTSSFSGKNPHTTIDITPSEAGAGFQLMEFLVMVKPELLDPKIKELVNANRNMIAAMKITERLLANRMSITEIYAYFLKYKPAGVHPASVITFFSKNIGAICEPLEQMLRQNIQNNFLGIMVDNSAFLISCFAVPTFLTPLLLPLMRRTIKYFNDDSIPWNEAELRSIMAAPLEVQERVCKAIEARTKCLEARMTSGRKLAFWVGALALAGSTTYAFFRAPLNAVITIGASVAALPIVNRTTRIVTAAYKQGKALFGIAWKYVVGNNPEKELKKLKVTLASNMFICSRGALVEDGESIPCFKITVRTINYTAFHITQVLSLLFLDQGLQVQKIDKNVLYLPEASLGNIEQIQSLLLERIEKISQSEQIISQIKKNIDRVSLVDLEREYESEPYKIILQIKNIEYADRLKQFFPAENPDQPWDLFKICLTEENRRKLEKWLKIRIPSALKVPIEDLQIGSSGPHAIDEQIETTHIAMRKEKRWHMANPQEAIFESASSSSGPPDSRAEAESGARYFFKANFDKRSWKQYPELCQRVVNKIEKGEVTFVRAKGATGAKRYGGKGVFVPTKGLFRGAFKFPSTKVRAWFLFGAPPKGEAGIGVTFVTMARSENLKSL